MADRFITRNGVRKVIDDSNAELVSAAHTKGWAFEDERAPVAEAPAPEPSAGAFVRMQRGDEVKDVAPELLETARQKGWSEVGAEPPTQPEPMRAGAPEVVEEVGQGLVSGTIDAVSKMRSTAVDTGRAWSEGLAGSVLPDSFMARLEAINPYVAKRLTGQDADWDAEVKAAREGIAQRGADHALARLGGGVVGAVGQAGLAAPAVAAATKAVAAKAGAGLFGRALAGAAGLAVEGAGLSAVEATRDEIGKAIDDGDWKAAAERLPGALLERAAKGAALNISTGAIAQGVSSTVKFGLKSLRKGATEAVEAADDELVQALDNEAIARTESAELRAAELRHAEETRQALNVVEDATTLESKATAELQQALELAQPKLLPEPGSEGAKMARAFEAAETFETHAKDNVHRLKEALDVLEENAEYADTHLALAQKNRVIRDAENGYGQAINDPEVGAMFDRFSAQLRREAETALDTFTEKRLTGLATMAERARAMVGKRLSAGDVGDAHVLLANMNRELGKLAASGKRSQAVDIAKSQYAELRALLEREDLFGEAAKIQKPFNAVWAPEITAEGADALSGMTGRTGTASAIDPFIKSERVKTGWVESHLKDLSDGAIDKDKALRQYIATKTASQSVRADLLGSAEGLERAAKSREAMATALQILDENAAKKQGAREWQAYERRLTRENLLGGGLQEQGAAAAVKFAADQTVGRVPVVGSVVSDALANKLTASELKTAMRTARQQAEKNAIARKATADQLAAAVRKAQAARDRAATKAATRTDWTLRGERVVAPLPTPATRAAVRKSLEEVDREREAPPSGPLSALTPVLGLDLTQAYAEQRTARNAFLLSKAGPAPAATPFGQPRRVMADADVDRFGRYLAAADDPDAALERMASGLQTAEDLETLRALYPSRLQDFRAQVLAKVAQRKQPLAYDEQLALSASLGMDAAMNGPASAFWSTVAQGGQAAAEAPGKPTRRKVDLAGASAATQGDRIG